MSEEKQKFLESIKLPLLFVVTIWCIKVIETSFGVSFSSYGLYPRELFGLTGIVTFPLLHGSWDHLISNTLPMLFFTTALFYFYPKSAKPTFIALYIVPGILLWLFARPSFHIGASAIVYGLAAFIFFSGIIRKDKRSIILACILTFFYGGMVWGILPYKDGVSWEGHLFGGLTGVLMAFVFRKRDPFQKYKWEDDENDNDDDYDVRDLEVSYKKGYPFE
jgi:membrane associated rhomboid family serine protease